MAMIDDDWNPVKENHPPLQRKRKSVVPKSAPTIDLEDPALQYHDFKDNKAPLQRRRSVVPKSAPTIHHEDPALQQHHDFKDNNAPSQRRKSVVPKTVSTLHNDDLVLRPHEFENKQPPSQKRKSIAPKATFSLYAENPVLPQEVEINNPPSRRRKSVVPKVASTLHADDLVLHQGVEVNNPPSRRRKSVVPKAASSLHVDDPTLLHPKWEENHSSLPRKRKSVAPKAASTLQPVDPILEKRNELEKELNEYSGNDPLSVWSKYIKWVEQTFIKGERDGQFEPLIERCISTFKNTKHYYNDMRFIEIWLKYASLAKNPVKVYNYMFMRKIGCASAGFFIAWAGKLEEEGNMIRASEVLQEGIKCKSEPVKKIESYWAYFKVRAGSNIMADSKQNEEEVKDNHSSKHNQIPEKKSISIPSQVIESKKPTETDVQQPLLKNSTLKPSSSNANVENPVSLKTPNSSGTVFSSNRNFRQSCFYDTRLSIMPRVSNVLEVQQDCENPPIALFEPPDPMKVPMYDKGKVYAGAQEVSLEEIRAATWFQKKRTIDHEKKIAEQDKVIAEQLEKICSLQQEIELLKEKLSKVEPNHINDVQEECAIPKKSAKKFPIAPLCKSGSKTRNETGSQVQIAQVRNPSALESCDFSIENPDAVSYKTTEDSKLQSQKAVKNGYSERVLGTILENGEDSYRSSSGSSKSIAQSCHQENTFRHENDFKKSEQQNKITNSVISEKIIESKTFPIRENFEILCTNVDPFDEELNEKLLNSLNLPPEYYGNVQTSKRSIKSLHIQDLIQVGDVTYVIESPIAAGSYGKVFVAVEQCPNSNSSKSKVALKICKQTSFWEIYMCMTLHRRLEQVKHAPDVCSSIMKITSAHRYSNSIIFTNEYSHRGTLLNLVHSYKRGVPELLTMYITLEMLQIMFKIHECNIIHADVKPDNVLIRDNISKQDVLSSLSQKTLLVKFIDFGRAIDLTLFEKGTCFETTLKKDQCVEMIEKKPWVFQLDWFGVLNCVHVLLFSDYMKVKKQANGRWGIVKKFKRYWDQTIWVPLFDELLNIPSCYEEPNIVVHISRIETKLKQNIQNFEIEPN